MDWIVLLVRVAVLAICVLAWSIIGLVFWIPLLTRETAMFSARVMHASITQQSMRDSSNGLEVAASFYINGFVTAIKAVGFGSSSSPSENIRPRLLILLFESAWTAITWFVIFLLMGNSLAHDALSGILYLFIKH
jgi:hypothetical protein